MFTLRKSFRFEAAHRLPNHDGKCERLHGHSWLLTVEVKGQTLAAEGPKTGMVADYSDLKALVQPFVDEFLDHHYLNETLCLEAPTSEAIARWVYEALATVIARQDPDWALSAVEINETCTSACRYEEA